MKTFKFYSKLIFYSLVGIFYRKDLRIVNYRIKANNIIYLDYDGYITETENDVLKRLNNSDEKLSFKDKLNLKRLNFGKYIYEYKKDHTYGLLFLRRIRLTFLSDVFLGKKLELVWNDKYLCYYNILRLLKKFTDYSLHKEIKI